MAIRGRCVYRYQRIERTTKDRCPSDVYSVASSVQHIGRRNQSMVLDDQSSRTLSHIKDGYWVVVQYPTQFRSGASVSIEQHVLFWPHRR